MNAYALRYAARRAKRANLWAAVIVAAVFLVLVVKGQTTEQDPDAIPTRHLQVTETAH